MTQGFGGFLLLLGAGWGCCCGADCRAGGDPGFKCVLSQQIMMKIKMLNSIKTKSIPSFCRKSLRCVAGIFAVTNDVFDSQRSLYSVGLIPVCLSVRLVRLATACLLGVDGLLW